MKITLPKAPSVNHMYGRNRFGGMYITEEGNRWITVSKALFKRQMGRFQPYLGIVAVYVNLYICGRYDIDNGMKCLLDLLMKVGYIKDDSQVMFLQIQKEKVPHRTDEKIEVEIVKDDPPEKINPHYC